MLYQFVQQNRHDGGEHAGPGRHDPVHQSEVFLKVVSQDGQRRCVRQRSTQSEHDSVGEVQSGNVVGEERRQEHASAGQTATDQGGRAETDLVGQDAGDWR